MIGMLLSLLLLLLVLGIVWVIIQKIPVPPDLAWVVQVIFLILCLIAVVSVLTGAFSIGDFGHWRGGCP